MSVSDHVFKGAIESVFVYAFRKGVSFLEELSLKARRERKKKEV
jgi:hypothetical protein